MDVMDIFDSIDIYGKVAKQSQLTKNGVCESCRRTTALYKDNDLCAGCYSFIGSCPQVPGSSKAERFSGAMFANVHGAIQWVGDRKYGHAGPDLQVFVDHNWLAKAFDFVFRYSGGDPYVFVINSSQASLTLDWMYLNGGPDIIRISGPDSPVVETFRDSRVVRRTEISAELKTNALVPKPRTPAERFVSVMANYNYVGNWKNKPGIAKWTL